jgi:MoxR-like ATPase
MEAWTTKFWIAGLLACANIAVFEHFFTMFMPLVLLTGSTAALRVHVHDGLHRLLYQQKPARKWTTPSMSADWGDSLEELARKLAATGYFIDPVMTQVVFLAAKLQKPLLLEGPAGSGKTQLALSVAAAGNTHVERLQCYRGVTEDKAIGRFDEGLQRLYMEFSKGQHENWQMVQANLKGRDFFRAGPLMRALECERPCVLLIDELDKVDDGFEPMLLEILSAWQLSIPEFGTVAAKSIPFVVLTSNEERRLGDPIRRRSLYVRVEHPTPEREAEIIASRTPKADEKFHREMAGIALSFRNYSLEKPPSVSEMIDFANALQLLGADHVTEEHRDVLLPFLAKTEKDRRHLLLREGFKSLLDDGARFAQSLMLPGRPTS